MIEFRQIFRLRGVWHSLRGLRGAGLAWTVPVVARKFCINESVLKRLFSGFGIFLLFVGI